MMRKRIGLARVVLDLIDQAPPMARAIEGLIESLVREHIRIDPLPVTCDKVSFIGAASYRPQAGARPLPMRPPATGTRRAAIKKEAAPAVKFRCPITIAIEQKLGEVDPVDELPEAQRRSLDATGDVGAICATLSDGDERGVDIQ
eukprot:scaffold131137_cov31-Tisochrysis_lutea.AAC.3